MPSFPVTEGWTTSLIPSGSSVVLPSVGSVVLSSVGSVVLPSVGSVVLPSVGSVVLPSVGSVVLSSVCSVDGVVEISIGFVSLLTTTSTSVCFTYSILKGLSLFFAIPT